MLVAFVVSLVCLAACIVHVVCSYSAKRKERELIEQVTPVTRGEWSERRVVLELLKVGVNPKAIFHDLYIQKPNGEYTQVDLAVATKAGISCLKSKIIAVGFSAANIRSIGRKYCRMVKNGIGSIIPLCKIPGILELSGNACRRIPEFRFILS